MPRQHTPMDEVRKKLVMKALQAGQSFAALCREFRVSCKTGYTWKPRGVDDGLKDRREPSLADAGGGGRHVWPTVWDARRGKGVAFSRLRDPATGGLFRLVVGRAAPISFLPFQNPCS